LAPDGRAGLALPGPVRLRHRKPVVSSAPIQRRICVPRPARARWMKSRPLAKPPPTSTPARPHPKAAKVAGLSALPIALKPVDYASAWEKEDKWIFGVEFVGETRRD